MRHDLSLEGSAFRLRPVSDADARLVVELRNNEALNSYLHATPPGLESQLAWLARYYDRE